MLLDQSILSGRSSSGLPICVSFSNKLVDDVCRGLSAKIQVEQYAESIISSRDLKIGFDRIPDYNHATTLKIDWLELIELVKMVRTHTRCSLSYYKRGVSTAPCKFKYPKYINSKITLRVNKF